METRTSTNINVKALSGGEWRVTDRRIARDNALSLVGFISKAEGSYEVMEFVDPVEHFVFPTWDDAVAHFGTAVLDDHNSELS
ncbi:hypothetical protein [Cryobacterium sp. MDB2-33-2]|uniref:hypothetical protein n=1 Tax=Cryobacterium sp. MDB2-33-2 TaxID=1259179 RepID=UPI00106A2C78|nr:hypothetical protein [Cryobacterium sp. MDB2-33-2]TFC11998.1 hypothetical protein E3O59_00020 [Cryobacterium sp. MDB2-33-2]